MEKVTDATMRGPMSRAGLTPAAVSGPNTEMSAASCACGDEGERCG